MCGIFGYIGDKDSLETCLKGLEQLEYRGYDSTGIAGILEGRIATCKKAGKLANLKKELKLKRLDIAIGHTRWATHGKVNDLNAHPHLDATEKLAIVHNGIIENYRILRESLESEGVKFVSETDTEVIVQLIAKFDRGDFLEAVQVALPYLKGIFAIAIIHKDHPDQIIAAAKECPVAIGTDDAGKEAYISSDPNTFGAELNVVYLHDNEIARVKRGKVEVFNGLASVAKKTVRIDAGISAPSKEGYEHFLLKEIFEQPTTIQKAIHGRFDLDGIQIRPCTKVLLLGCGTSAHAGTLGAQMIEEIAKIPASCDIASEARYREPLLNKETLVLAISQSGETADTIAALREIKGSVGQTISICNVKHSTITRETDHTIYLKAGPEISVCSSKALTSQIAILFLVALQMGRRTELFQEIKTIPEQIQQVLDQAPLIEQLAKKYASYDDFFFMGRSYMYTTAMEAALKLKEISYVNANGYPAGELKHGAIALLSTQFPVVAFCSNQKTKDKILSNLTEVKARGAPLLAFAPLGMEGVASIADDVIWLPPTIDSLAPFASTVAGQLLAYYIAKERGCDIDQPRNLAKSVTVE
jgi:glucosamine--fructose-6-phosphate aminotransferase (isomerizing)